MLNTTKLLSSFAIISVIFIGPAAANEIGPGQLNTGFATVAALESHPSCNGAGDRAIKMQFEMENLYFRLASSSWDRDLGVYPTDVSVDPDSCTITERRGGETMELQCNRYTEDETRPVQQCTVTERRGVERIELQVDCPDQDAGQDLFSSVTTHTPRLDISGTVTMCQSLASYRVVEGEWQADVTIDDQTVRSEGELLLPGSYACEGAVDDPRPRGGIAYFPEPTLLSGQPLGFQRHHSFYRFWIDHLPVQLPNTADAAVLLQSSALFFPTLENEKHVCEDRGCSGWPNQRPDSRSWRACQ